MDFDCTEEEFREFETMIKDKDFKCSFSRDLLLVLLGVKPGCAANTYREVEENKDEIRNMGLNIKKVKLDFAEIPEWCSEDNKEEFKHQFFVAKNPNQLEVLEDKYSDNELTEFRRDFGIFCGYPEEDVKWFVEDADGEISNAVEEYEKSEFEISEPDLVNYVPKPSEDRIRKAEEISEKYRSALLRADEIFKSNVGRDLVNLRVEK